MKTIYKHTWEIARFYFEANLNERYGRSIGGGWYLSDMPEAANSNPVESFSVSVSKFSLKTFSSIIALDEK